MRTLEELLPDPSCVVQVVDCGDSENVPHGPPPTGITNDSGSRLWGSEIYCHIYTEATFSMGSML